ncbi:hypothetical protein J5N97_029137 [Dioscorea zingiberensis]|uniref:Uncharacterized protein n=1 Tax=Dioscorea zingiberensis TaxID=325984 RepID=A0A9D5C0B0_9LILI|nr:hypothetical protein J5N97_029137 [Dioscorea zingiberensis]
MARKWQKVSSLKRKISSPRADECADFSACSTSSIAEKGHFFVYTSEGKRFMVPLAYLDNNIFKELLKISEEEFGLPGDGPITLPCDAVSMEYVLSMLRRGVSQEVERALLSSIFVSCPHVLCLLLKRTEHVDWQEMKMELSNALSTSLDTPLLSKDNTYSMDTASQGNVIGPLLAKPNSSADFFKSSLKISLSSESETPGTEVLPANPVGKAVTAVDTGSSSTPAAVHHINDHDMETMPRLSEGKEERGLGPWMTQRSKGNYRGRGRGRGGGGRSDRGGHGGRGAGRGGGASDVPTITHMVVDDHVPKHVPHHEHVPSQSSLEELKNDHVEEPQKTLYGDVQHVEAPSRRRPVGYSTRGGHSRGGKDDRLITFVKERTSRDRSVEDKRGIRARSRSVNRSETRQVESSSNGGSRSEFHRRSTPSGSGRRDSGSADRRRGTRGENLMITSLRDEEEHGQRPNVHNPNPKGKVRALNPPLSSHMGLVRRLSQALEKGEAEIPSDGDSIEEDEPPDRGEGPDVQVLEDSMNKIETSPMEATYPKDQGQQKSRPQLSSQDCCP